VVSNKALNKSEDLSIIGAMMPRFND